MKTPSLFALLLFWIGFILINGIHNTLAIGLGIAVAASFISKIVLFIRQIIKQYPFQNRMNHWA